ncbi:hypothetical protein [Streptomyces sp. MP131-18]|uniref:hypothetical protein n=1 Tax=Streptomyces sp. MP131-18 TaxID=1857892 RepID=UPI00097C22E6|nr:hypothetical protein [Streptomyces sp. MP131-18]ONK12241.1 hypothetical protein STBA_29810 [Streptomyces sp. MP131-18]
MSPAQHGSYSAGTVEISVEITVSTVQVNDRIMIGGMLYSVRDMKTAPGGRKQLLFHSGETFTMLRSTIMWAARNVDPRVRNTRIVRPARHTPG